MKTKGNCLKIKNSHKNKSGNKADFSFLITINFIRAPATKMPRRLFIYQTSGRIRISTIAIATERIIETAMIWGVLLRKIEVKSIK